MATRLRHALVVGERLYERIVRVAGRWRYRWWPAPTISTIRRPATAWAGPAALRVVLDPRDVLPAPAVRRALLTAWPSDPATFVVLIRYRTPPLLAARMDAPLHSWAAAPEVAARLPGAAAPLFVVLETALQLPEIRVQVVQVGGPTQAFFPEPDSLLRSAWVIPHRGSAQWLAECLARLQPQLRADRDEALICLDERESPALAAVRAAFPACWFGGLRRPGVGPFVARQRAAERTTADVLLFQDSDDVPTADRAATLYHALASRGLDAVGSHELRLDYLTRTVVARRFPVDASAALRVAMGHPILFPTLLVRRASLLAVGGFSTHLRFGLDTQLLLRAAPAWRIGNVDAFLYIRRRRPGSLTTDPATAIGSPAREFHRVQWHRDYAAALNGETAQPTNSLAVRRGSEYDDNLLEPL